ncbi:hypothetical protein MMC07_008071 [Pseudocyphellaria aurata]|nr:hypothetical protein [Pseudocyphellaria aurata]
MSGNGVSVPHSDLRKVTSFPGRPSTVTVIPAGTGGGCVITGPLANLTVAFGQVSPDLNPGLRNNPRNLDYKPHCLRRDLNPKVAESVLTPENVRAVLGSPNITVFYQIMNFGVTPGEQGLHGGGHQAVGGDMSDFFSSPGDPLFYLHHAQVDRIWTRWQQLDLTTRQYALSGTGTVRNYPPSPLFNLNDTLNLGSLSPEGPRPIRDIMSTVLVESLLGKCTFCVVPVEWARWVTKGEGED